MLGRTDKRLTSESIEGTSLAFQGIDDVHGSDGLSLGMLGVGDSITDHVLKEDLQNSTLNLGIHRGYVPGVSGHRRRPWLLAMMTAVGTGART